MYVTYIKSPRRCSFTSHATLFGWAWFPEQQLHMRRPVREHRVPDKGVEDAAIAVINDDAYFRFVIVRHPVRGSAVYYCVILCVVVLYTIASSSAWWCCELFIARV